MMAVDCQRRARTSFVDLDGSKWLIFREANISVMRPITTELTWRSIHAKYRLGRESHLIGLLTVVGGSIRRTRVESLSSDDLGQINGSPVVTAARDRCYR